MKLIIIFTSVLLVGCASKPVPVTAKFPEAPQILLEPCSELKRLQEGAKLSDVAKIVVENYTQYHECSTKTKAWTEWYKAQKSLFEEVK